jgi:HD-like signal output (HDOD) protein/tRNA A-37 threonylcarbamoyl transferase component Bud32
MIDVIDTVNSALPPPSAGQRSMEKDKLLERLLRNPRIPSPPTLALQVLQKTSQENCTVDEICELLALDAGLCAKILKTMNSCAYGRSRAVTSVRQAVATLGSMPLRSLVLGLTLPVVQATAEPDAGLRRFWRKSVAGAVMARDLAMHCQWPAPGDAMAAGLLRNLGMILLHQGFQDIYDPVWSATSAIAVTEQCAWEDQHLGINHAEAGAALLEQWQLPIELVEPIRFHHHPGLLPADIRELVDRAYLLDFVSRLADMDAHPVGKENMAIIIQSARERYGLSHDELMEFLAGVSSRIEAFSSILGVDIGPCPDFGESLMKSCEQLVRVSLESSMAIAPASRVDYAAKTIDYNGAAEMQIHNLLADPNNLSAYSKILHYEVIEVIGRGANGIVLKALDPGLARYVAIKLLAPEMLNSEKARQRFALEARFAASLRHEHIVSVHAVNMLDGIPFIVMEYVCGASLEDLLKQGRVYTGQEIARIGRQTALGLAAAHGAHLIHRDVKPANILIDEYTGYVRVADFGLARALDVDMHISLPGLLVGTPLYMSPEQVDGKPLTSASDLFSLGSVLYTLCTGEPPFHSETMSGLLCAVADKEPMPIGTLNPSIPEWLIRVIQSLHAKDPAARPADAATVAEMLQTK